MAEVVDLETIAGHEAAHATMRWIHGWPATELTATADGGLCAGTGATVPPGEHVLVLLAGFAWEAGCVAQKLDHAGCRADDFDKARETLAQCVWLRGGVRDGAPVVLSVDDAMQEHFDEACRLLWEHFDMVELLGGRLAREGRLSARRVAAMFREYAKRLEGR